MSDLEVCNKVFVYGTLKKDHYNSRVFDYYEAEYLGPVVTEDEYILGDVGYPYMFPEDVCESGAFLTLGKKVLGDLWEIPNDQCLKSLDLFEGVPRHYTRELIDLSNGSVAWAYLQRDWDRVRNCSMCYETVNNEWEWRKNYGY